MRSELVCFSLSLSLTFLLRPPQKRQEHNVELSVTDGVRMIGQTRPTDSESPIGQRLPGRSVGQDQREQVAGLVRTGDRRGATWHGGHAAHEGFE